MQMLPSLRPSEAYMHQKTRPSMFQIMTCWNGWSVPSHCLNQCWNIVHWTLRNKRQWHFNRNSMFSFKEMYLKTSSGKWRLFCSGLQCTLTSELSLRRSSRHRNTYDLIHLHCVSVLVGIVPSDLIYWRIYALSYPKEPYQTVQLYYILRGGGRGWGGVGWGGVGGGVGGWGGGGGGGGYWFHGFTLSVCPSVDRIMYLPQYSPDPFHIYTSYQATSELVSFVKFFFFQN